MWVLGNGEGVGVMGPFSVWHRENLSCATGWLERTPENQRRVWSPVPKLWAEDRVSSPLLLLILDYDVTWCELERILMS